MEIPTSDESAKEALAPLGVDVIRAYEILREVTQVSIEVAYKAAPLLVSKIQGYHKNPYDEISGYCMFCGGDTLWGDAPHKDNCAYARAFAEAQPN